MPAKHSLTEGSIPRALVAFALPILFGNVLQSVNGSVNAIWVGKFLGEAALAAVGNSNVVMFCCSAPRSCCTAWCGRPALSWRR